MNHRYGFAAMALLLVAACHGWAGGSGLNVLIVVNGNSTNSVELGNYYAERRQVPSHNYLRINWPGGNVSWSAADFNACLLNPLLGMMASQQLTNQIDYVVLSTDIPYRVTQGGAPADSGENSTTAALYYGFKSDYSAPSYDPPSCNLPAATSNSYAGSEGIFRTVTPATATTNALLAMMITSSNLASAKAVIDHGVTSDGSFSSQSVILGKSSDVFRNIRFIAFDNAIFNTRLRNGFTVSRADTDTPYYYNHLLGYQNGHYIFVIQPDTFVPGAMADSLTSFGGKIYEVNDQTTLLAFLAAGASGSYGTVVEPCNYQEKFPSPQTYFYQSRGFSLAECYYQSITNPYQGLLAGEPLAAPFALPANGFWSNLPPNAVLAGTTNLSFAAVAADATRPVQQVDLFVDGRHFQTVTNIPPRQNNVVTVTIRGRPMSYTVPAGANLKSVVEGLAAVLNLPASVNATRVRAFVHGDRIELQSSDDTRTASQIPLTTGSSSSSGAPLTTFVSASAPGFLDTVATGIRSYEVKGSAFLGSYLLAVVTKTNNAQVSVAVTNTSGSLTLFQMVQQVAAGLNSHPDLASGDGLNVQDFVDLSPYSTAPTVQFNILANSSGWGPARIRVNLSASTGITVTPSGAFTLEENISDLQPRAHLYITAGVTNLPLVFPFSTDGLPDGSHQFSAVIYEGSHVRTQRRVSQDVVIRNHTLAATFTTLPGGSNIAVEATLQFAVVANRNDVASIQLFSTGGLVSSVANQSNSVFALPAASLGAGLHPFYAVVAASTGQQYRTETKWLRIVGAEGPFQLTMSTPPPTVSWPATAGRSYEILSKTNLADAYQLNATLTPTNTSGQWTDTNPPSASRFYRVKTAN